MFDNELVREAIDSRRQVMSDYFAGRLREVAIEDKHRRAVLVLLASREFDGHNAQNIASKAFRRLGLSKAAVYEIASPEISRAQAMAKLDGYEDSGVEWYDIETWGDKTVCDHCSAMAAGGPYAIESRTFTDAAHCPTCRCSVRARV